MTMEFDRTIARALAREVELALAPLAERYDLSITIPHLRYEETVVELKVICATIDRDAGLVLSREASDYRRYAQMFGLPEDGLGRELTVKGQRYRLDGLALNSRKYPILVTRLADGKRFKFTAESITRAFARGV